jgi:cytochrome c553
MNRSIKTQFCSRLSLVMWLACSFACFAMSLSAQAQNANAGKDKAGMCAMCHGPTGLSQLPNAPHLAGQPAIYLIEQMKNYRSGKRPNEVMAVIAKPLTDQEIDDLAAWYASIEITVKVK